MSLNVLNHSIQFSASSSLRRTETDCQQVSGNTSTSMGSGEYTVQNVLNVHSDSKHWQTADLWSSISYLPKNLSGCILLIQFWDNDVNQIITRISWYCWKNYNNNDETLLQCLLFLLFLSNILVNSSFVMTPSPSGSSSAIISWNLTLQKQRKSMTFQPLSPPLSEGCPDWPWRS